MSTTTLPDYLFTGTNGNLFDTREKGWSSRPLRERYSYTFGNIKNVSQLKATLRNGRYAWPGGYPMHFLTSDGATLCFDCVRDNFRNIADSIKNDISDGWKVVACDINWEDDHCPCDDCGKLLECAYPSNDEEEN